MKHFQVTCAMALAAGLIAMVPARAQELRIEHVTIVSPERAGALRDVDVWVHEGRIASIEASSARHKWVASESATTTILDGKGMFLTPGLIDSHVHLDQVPGMTPEQEQSHGALASAARAQLPRSYLLHGFTTLVDLVSEPQAMQRWRSHVPGPDTYFCGAAALMDGYPMNWLPKQQRYEKAPYMVIEPGTAPPAGIDPAQHTPQAVVARMKRDGAICVKTFFERGFGSAHDLPVPKLETVRALVAAAHASGMPVFLHANSQEAQAFGVQAGVDVLAHGMWNWDDSTPKTQTDLTPSAQAVLDGVLENHIGWQPTIQVLAGLRDLFHPEFLADPELARVANADLIAWYRSPEGQWFHDEIGKDFEGKDPAETAKTVDRVFNRLIARDSSATRYLAQHGGRLLFGTDTPSGPIYANQPGWNGWLEIQDLAAAGETPIQIFRSATLDNARAVHLDEEIGTVEIGKRANLLLLRADPTQSIEAYDTIARVILRGRVYGAGDLTAEARNR